MTSGELPDVSAFRSLIGNEAQLVFWLAISWTFAAFMEEIVYRGWIMKRFAELWTIFEHGAWIAGLLGVVCILRRRPSLSGCVRHDCHRRMTVRLRMRLPCDRTGISGRASLRTASWTPLDL